MTKSIEAQAEEYAGKRYDKYLGTHISESWSITKANYLAGAKVRDVQWAAVVNELKEAIKHIIKNKNVHPYEYHHYTRENIISLLSADLIKADQMLKEMGIKNE